MGDSAISALGLAIVAAAVVVVTVLRMRSELRRFGNAIWLTLSLCLVLAAGTASGAPAFAGIGAGVVVLVVLSPLVTVFLVVACLANGVVMIRREGTSPGNLLSLLLGLAMVGLIALLVLGVVTRSVVLIALSLFGTLAAGYFAFVFVALVLYAFVYATIVRRRIHSRAVDAVIVLGSGLGGGTEVTPLLRGRIDEGLRVAAQAARHGPPPVLIMSGGQGADEQISEAEAMSRYALAQGVPPAAVLAEDRSTNTRENLRFSAELLARRRPAALEPADRTAGPGGEVRSGGAMTVVVTSSYHAFRAAVEARLAGVDAQAVGGRTAAYFWLSATLREFVAFLREHRVAHAIVLAVIAVPVPLGLLVLAAAR